MTSVGYVKVINNVAMFELDRGGVVVWKNHRKYTWEEFIKKYPYECSWGTGFRRTNDKKFI